MTQNKCKVIGLTGGIASGKTTVSNILIGKGYDIIDADLIAREVVEVGTSAYYKIVEVFGHEILLKDKTINRRSLGKIIFNDKKSREKLNNITHPIILETIKIKLLERCEEGKIIFLDIPLLFEQYDLWKEFGIEFDEIVLVYLNNEDQIERLKKRDNISEEEALVKIKSQLPIDEKLKRASKTIDNSGDVQQLNDQIEKLLFELT